MELNIDMIIMVVTAVVTAIFGMLAKKFNWETKDYIPFQNLIIGILAGLAVFCTGLNKNVLNAIVICVFSAFTAGGAYDFIKTNRDSKEE